MIQRAHAPSAGLWSIPGGRCLPGESGRDACVREVAEETGLQVRVLRMTGLVEIDGQQARYQVEDYLCEVVRGQLRAGDDADQAQWVSYAELLALPTAPGLVDALRDWNVLPD